MILKKISHQADRKIRKKVIDIKIPERFKQSVELFNR